MIPNAHTYTTVHNADQAQAECWNLDGFYCVRVSEAGRSIFSIHFTDRTKAEAVAAAFNGEHASVIPLPPRPGVRPVRQTGAV